MLIRNGLRIVISDLKITFGGFVPDLSVDCAQLAKVFGEKKWWLWVMEVFFLP